MNHDFGYPTYVSATGVVTSSGTDGGSSASQFRVVGVGSTDNAVQLVRASNVARTSRDSSASDSIVDEHDVVFAALFGALNEFQSADGDDPAHIDSDTYRSSCSVLSFFQYYGFPAPRVFSHGGDAVVFTWASGPSSLQLTISNGIAALGRRVKGKGVSALGYVELCDKSIAELFPFAKVGSGRAWSSSLR